MSQPKGLFALLFLACGTSLWAAPATIPHGTVELVTEHASIQPGQKFRVGLRFLLEKGWHIYWINPGDAGQPPRVTWDLPAGLTAAAIEWPYPKPLPAFSLMDFGYEDEVLLLVPMQASPGLKPGTTVAIKGDLKTIVCREVCIPGKAQVTATLPVANHAPVSNPAIKPIFDTARRKLPVPTPVSWKIKVVDQKDSFLLAATTGSPAQQAFFFPLEESQIENASPQAVKPNKSGFELTLKKSNQLLKPLRHLKGVLLLENNAYVINTPVK